MPSAMEWIFGSSPKLSKKATGTPEQQAFGQSLIEQLNQMSGPQGGFGLAQNYFNQLLGPGGYDQFAAPYMQQYQEQVLPSIAERFGGMGALSSSGFAQALGGSASGLQSQLAQLFSQLQQQAAGANYGQYNQMASTGLGYQPFAYHEKQGTTGAAIPILAAVAEGLAGSARGGV